MFTQTVKARTPVSPTLALTLLALILVAGPAAAQSPAPIAVGIQFTQVNSGEFDDTDVGVGGRIAWQPTAVLGLEGELTTYPSEFPGDGVAFSSHRLEGLFGVTAGPRFGRLRPFARGRIGFLTFGEASQPLVCLAIFPPPLSCQLAAGDTLLALEIGGGLELDTTPGTFLRLDIGDRAVKYAGPVFDPDFQIREDGFFGHDLRVAVGGGFRFGR